MTWEYQHGTWRSMRPEDALKLEEGFCRDAKGSVRVECGRRAYTVDFAEMTQTNCHTGKVRKIRRVPFVVDKKVVYFIRHGQSEANAVASGGSIPDPALTELGRCQAAALRPETEKWCVGAVYVSPLLRTLQTACLAFSDAVPLEVSRCAREHGWSEPQNRGAPPEELRERLEAAPGVQAERLQGLGKLRRPHKFWDPAGERQLGRRELRHRRREASEFLKCKIQTSAHDALACVCHYRVIKKISGVGASNAEVVRCTLTWDAAGKCTLLDAEKLALPAAAEEALRGGGGPCDAPPAPARAPSALPALPPNLDSDMEEVSRQDLLPAADDPYSGSSSAGEAEEVGRGGGLGAGCCGGGSAGSEPRSDVDRPRSASVLVVGRSAHCGGAPAVLLGGVKVKRSNGSVAFCDFGGGLDGGSGGRRHAAEERARPALGAFRELVEELLGMHGPTARDVAGKLAQGAEVVGGRPIPHRGHLLYVCTAGSILAQVGAAADPSESAIDQLAGLFQPSSEVACVTLVPIDELLRGAATACVSPAAPVWGSWSRHGRARPFSFEACLALEQAQDQPGASLVVQTKDGPCTVSPASLQLQGPGEDGKERSVFRWDVVQLREALVGGEGSLATLREPLLRWASEC